MPDQDTLSDEAPSSTTTRTTQTPIAGQDAPASPAAARQDLPSPPSPTAPTDTAEPAATAAGVGRAPAGDTGEVDVEALLTQLDRVDVKRLRKHPRIAGLLGSDLERLKPTLRQELRNELLPALRDELELERLSRFAETPDLADRIKEADPEIAALADAKLQEVRARAAGRRQQAQEEAIRANAAAQATQQDDAFMARVASWQAKLPETVRREVAGKDYESFEHYLEAVAVKRLEQDLKERTPALRSAIEKELRDAVELDVQGEARKREPALDLGNGRPASGAVTLDLWASWDRATRKQWQRGHPKDFDDLMKRATYGTVA